MRGFDSRSKRLQCSGGRRAHVAQIALEYMRLYTSALAAAAIGGSLVAVWRIYYGDGSTVEGDTRAEWVAAPARNVQVVVASDTFPPGDVRNVGRVLAHAHDFYLWAPRMPLPWGVDGIGLLDHLLEANRITADITLSQLSIAQLTAWGVKMARTISDSEFDAILQRAMNDPGFPPKSATRPGREAFDALPRV